MVQLGSALNALAAPPIQALFVYNSNPAAVCPNHNEVVRGLKRPDLFTVVHEQFFTDTTDYADIVLPATTFFEHKDLQTAYGHYYIQVSNQAMDPVGECRSNVEMFRALAERMGFEDECFRETVDAMIDRALESSNPWLKGIARERLEREHRIRLNFADNDGAATNPVGTDAFVRPAERSSAAPFAAFLPFAQGNFPTPSGKAEFYSETLKRRGLDPVVAFTPPDESRHGSKAAVFPWSFLPASRTIISTRHSPISHPCARWSPRSGISKSIPPMPRRAASAMAIGFAPSTRAARSSSTLGSTVPSLRSGCRAARLGTIQPWRRQYQCANLRKTYRHGQRGDVLFRLCKMEFVRGFRFFSNDGKFGIGVGFGC